MRHHRGIIQKETGGMAKLNDSPLGGLLAARMARRRHVPGTRTILSADVWNRLSPRDKARVEACLRDAAAEYGCAKAELMWAMDRNGIVHVKRREQICLTS